MLGNPSRFKSLRWWQKVVAVVFFPFWLVVLLIDWGIDYVIEVLDALDEMMRETHGN